MPYRGDAYYTASAALDAIHRRMDRVEGRRDAPPGQYPVRLELELSDTEFVPHLVEFLRYVKRSAGGGHSFQIAADESADPPGQMFGKQRAGVTIFIDGDGADKIGRILLNGKEVK